MNAYKLVFIIYLLCTYVVAPSSNSHLTISMVLTTPNKTVPCEIMPRSNRALLNKFQQALKSLTASASPVTDLVCLHQQQPLGSDVNQKRQLVLQLILDDTVLSQSSLIHDVDRDSLLYDALSTALQNAKETIQIITIHSPAPKPFVDILVEGVLQQKNQPFTWTPSLLQDMAGTKNRIMFDMYNYIPEQASEVCNPYSFLDIELSHVVPAQSNNNNNKRVKAAVWFKCMLNQPQTSSKKIQRAFKPNPHGLGFKKSSLKASVFVGIDYNNLEALTGKPV